MAIEPIWKLMILRQFKKRRLPVNPMALKPISKTIIFETHGH